MLKARELAKRLLATADGRVTVEEFEEWFEEHSWNIHRQGDQGLIDAVFRAEEAFSAYSDQRIGESTLRDSFAEIARELMSGEEPFSKIPFVLGETENASLTFALNGESAKHQDVPDWVPVHGAILQEEVAFGV